MAGVNISFFLINNTQMLFGNCPQVSKQNQDPTPPINKKLIEFGPLQKENWIFFLIFFINLKKCRAWVISGPPKNSFCGNIGP